jgi:hypothetical protein
MVIAGASRVRRPDSAARQMTFRAAGNTNLGTWSAGSKTSIPSHLLCDSSPSPVTRRCRRHRRKSQRINRLLSGSRRLPAGSLRKPGRRKWLDLEWFPCSTLGFSAAPGGGWRVGRKSRCEAAHSPSPAPLSVRLDVTGVGPLVVAVHVHQFGHHAMTAACSRCTTTWRHSARPCRMTGYAPSHRTAPCTR